MTLLVSGPLLSAGYIGAIVLLMTRPGVAARLAPLAAAGRLNLSNYLLQSLICTTLFTAMALPVRESRRRGGSCDHARDLAAAVASKHSVAAPLSLRTDRVAVARTQLRAPAVGR